MERYTYFEGGKWRLCVGETEHSGPWVDRLAAYEDTGLAPEEIERILDAYGRGRTLRTEIGERLEIVRGIPTDRLLELVKARDDGWWVDEKMTLAMAAGARAIENNKRLFGVTYRWDIWGQSGGPKEISYYEAAQRLREISIQALTRAEAEATLGGGGDGYPCRDHDCYDRGNYHCGCESCSQFINPIEAAIGGGGDG